MQGASIVYAINDVSLPKSLVTKSGLKLNADVYIVDVCTTVALDLTAQLFDTSAAKIKNYKAQGKRVVCYFSAGSYESPRPDAKSFDKACYAGHPMDGWPEYWLDTGSAACLSNIKPIMSARMDLARTKGCDAVDPVRRSSSLRC